MALKILKMGAFGDYLQKDQAIISDSLVTLVSAVVGKSIKVFVFELSSNASGLFWLKSGSNTFRTIAISANGNFAVEAIDRHLPRYTTNLGEALTIQASDAFASKADAFVMYKVE